MDHLVMYSTVYKVAAITVEPTRTTNDGCHRSIEIRLEDGKRITIDLYSTLDELKLEIE